MKRIAVFSQYLPAILIVTLKLCFVSCYPYGPPRSVCFTAVPYHKQDGHAIRPQKTPSPFKIIVNATTYKPGDVINIKVDTDNAETFKGLFLQVRPVKRSKKDNVRVLPLGKYRRVMQNTKIIGCDVAVDTIVHQDAFVKYTTEVNWIAPLLVKNDVIVRATVLANFSTYWTNVKSDIIRLEDVGPLPAEELQRPWLREIISTVQKKDDKEAMEEAVKARFEKGLNGALDPNGNVMVHYVMELLPFEDSRKYDRPKVPLGFKDEDSSSENDNEETTKGFITTTDSTTDKEVDSVTSKPRPLTEDSPKDQLYQTKAEAYYDVLVRAVLGGDKLVADALQKMIEKPNL